MIPEIGHFCLILAMVFSLIQTIALLSWRFNLQHPKTATIVSTAQFFCITISFAALMVSYAASDFSVLNVLENSHTDKPMLFKITGTWGNHEGSMLLWLWVLGLFGFLVSSQSFYGDTILKSATIGVQSALCLGVGTFILFTSNPFSRVFPPPANGQDLNPLLQDIGLAIHPPMLYLGYVGFSIVFSLAVAALINGKVNQAWAKIAQPWILLSWSFLTGGIALGSWWAYRELGWGGFWFWDPVENASLLSWMTGTALLHSNIVLMKRGLLKKWVIILAIITFSMSMIGTFLVRSGAITSVHSFASDPGRGLYILAYLVIVTGAALLLYAYKMPAIKSYHATVPFSREGIIIVNNLFMLTSAATILLATLYPMGMEFFQLPPVSIGPFYFNITILPLLGLALFFAAISPFMRWQKALVQEMVERLYVLGIVALASFVITLLFTERSALLGAIGISLFVWLAGSTLLFWWKIVAGNSGLHASFLKRLTMIPRATHGMMIAHLGAAIVVLGITGACLWKYEHEQVIKPSESFKLGSFDIRLDSEKLIRGANYSVNESHFSIFKDNQFIAALTPGIRRYAVRDMSTTEAAIDSGLLYDIYVVIGKTMSGDATTVRAYINPFMNILWIGCTLMVLGGLVSIRRTIPKQAVM